MNLRYFVVCTLPIALILDVPATPRESRTVRAADGIESQDFYDNFDVDHDFLSQGVADRGWDGFLGKGSRETADRIAATEGQLHLQSTRGRYQEGWDPLGPLLYKTVLGDFKATVRVEDYESLSYNNCGIMARAANLDDAGPGEDWISIDYFPIYGGIYARLADDNRRTEKGSNGQGRNADRFLQLERVGSLFFLRHSADGASWQELPASPITRSDLVNVPLQVGLFQATYTKNQGRVSFDEFSLACSSPVPTARLHSPEDEARNQPPKLTLSWVPGSGSLHHDVYVGASQDEVLNASPETAGVYRGRQEATEIDYSLDGLADGKTYFWRIDEVARDQIHPGQVWSFTLYDRAIETFEQYTSSEDLASQWVATAGASVTLVDRDACAGQRSMQLKGRTGEPDGLCEVAFTFAEDQDWLSSTYAFRSLRVHFRSAPENRVDRLYLAFEDEDWGSRRTVVEYEGDPAALRDSGWTRWDVDLRRLVENNPTFRLDHVKQIGLGIGRRDRADVNGLGSIDFDNISIEYRRSASVQGEPWPNYLHPDRFVAAVPFHQVAVTGGLWSERMDVNRTISLPHVWKCCEQVTKANGDDSRRLDNFRKAAGEIDGEFTGTFFNDSDVYKILEGTANSLRNHPDPELEAYADQVIDSIAAAQWEDGYLYTFYTVPNKKPQARWSNIGSMHELYCAGHLIEAAVAYHQATGKRKLLDVALRMADLICQTFGPGKREMPPGHQEIELALMKLYRHTGESRHMETAKFFVDQRGRTTGRRLYGTYSQDHIPFVQQETGVGHSVRAGYLYCAATDIAAENHDEEYANALHRIWDNILNTKTYLTGGIGQPGGPEGFAGEYELGNNCYAETCSGIAFAMWNHRLHQMTGESKYADLVERTFLNNMLSALSADGDRHCYTNPLMTGGRERWHWPGHDCACCPSNLVRLISSIGGYAYTHNDDTIFVNQYLSSQGTVSLSGNAVALTQETQYPWEGGIVVQVQPETPGTFAIRLRIPGWARGIPMPGNLYKYLDQDVQEIKLTVNGSPVDGELRNGYVEIRREWGADDTIRLNLPMPIRRVLAHPSAVANKGLVAVERGPMVYCAEFKDNAIDVAGLRLPDETRLTAAFDQDFFGGAVTLTSDNGLRLIPYYLYANRGQGWMRVWMPRE